MAQFDKPLAELQIYHPEIDEPADFDAFWKQTLNEAAAFDIDATFEPYTDLRLPDTHVFDVSFKGFGGQSVKGWLLLPNKTNSPIPCVVSYVGYGGGRSLPIAHTWASAAGMAHFVMDTRGQGSHWSPGDTPDEYPAGAPQAAGFLTRGIDAPQSYYYRRLITDAVRALQAAAAHPQIDANRLAVAGGSQGGALALAAAALSPQKPVVAMVDVPFLCHVQRAVTITDQPPYAELQRYLSCQHERAAQAMKTLSYFDGCHFAKRLDVQCFFSAALMDQICPPSCVFAAYNRIENAKKHIDVFPYNGHEGGDVLQLTRRVQRLQASFGTA